MEKSSNPNQPESAEPLRTLGKFQNFAGFKPEELETLLELCEEQSFPKGHVLFRQGDPGLCMYVILSGNVRIYQEARGQTLELAELGAGDFFGELSLIDDEPRSATVELLEDTRMLVLTRMVLGVLAGIRPGAAIQLLAAIGRSLVKRLRTGNQRYLDLVLLGHTDTAHKASDQ